ncbi:MAG TPA: hypothetical protein VHJ38_18640 [Nitrososphaeraceae archaeon]|jgi:hypothetical protein|nr:hypothetical protein [Nitrososphaeraceae archaeon]HSF00214.1 hypothetical protein [Nitrososphaeraceae archaeon]
MTIRVIEVWDAPDRTESLYQRINEVIRDNSITREELIDIKYSTVYIPDDKKITSQALIIFDKKDKEKEVVITELDVVDDKDELLRK